MSVARTDVRATSTGRHLCDLWAVTLRSQVEPVCPHDLFGRL